MQRAGNPNHGRGLVDLSEFSPCGVDIDALKLKLVSLFRSPEYKPPLLPTVALELLTISRKPRVNAAQVAELLGHDPMLAGQVLKIAQSALHARGEPVRSLDEAIVRLGLERVTDLFFQASLETRVFRAPGFDAEMEALRSHSAFSAEAARLVCRQTLGLNEYAFLCGLLHDVGIAACILALNELGPAKPAKFSDAWYCVREIHESCSELLAKVWQLPSDIALVLRLHHGLSFEDRVHPLAAAVAVADGLAYEAGFGFRDEISPERTQAAARALNLDERGLERLQQSALELAARLRG